MLASSRPQPGASSLAPLSDCCLCRYENVACIHASFTNLTASTPWRMATMSSPFRAAYRGRGSNNNSNNTTTVRGQSNKGGSAAAVAQWTQYDDLFDQFIDTDHDTLARLSVAGPASDGADPGELGHAYDVFSGSSSNSNGGGGGGNAGVASAAAAGFDGTFLHFQLLLP